MSEEVEHATLKGIATLKGEDPSECPDMTAPCNFTSIPDSQRAFGLNSAEMLLKGTMPLHWPIKCVRCVQIVDEALGGSRESARLTALESDYE